LWMSIPADRGGVGGLDVGPTKEREEKNVEKSEGWKGVTGTAERREGLKEERGELFSSQKIEDDQGAEECEKKKQKRTGKGREEERKVAVVV